MQLRVLRFRSDEDWNVIQSAFQRLKSDGARFDDEPHLVARMPKHDLWMTLLGDTPTMF